MDTPRQGQPGEATTVDRVVQALSRDMFEGRLKPGTQLREETLTQQFRVSRSSVREALRVLTMDGLLKRQPNRSVTVRHLTVAEVEDIYRARLLLEAACVREAADCPEPRLHELARALDVYVAAMALEPLQAADAHVEFHAEFVRILSGSLYLAATQRSLLRQLRLMFATVHMGGGDLNHEIKFHTDLCRLCIAREIGPALACLKEGLDDSVAFAVRYTLEAHTLARSQGQPSRLGT